MWRDLPNELGSILDLRRPKKRETRESGRPTKTNVAFCTGRTRVLLGPARRNKACGHNGLRTRPTETEFEQPRPNSTALTKIRNWLVRRQLDIGHSLVSDSTDATKRCTITPRALRRFVNNCRPTLPLSISLSPLLTRSSRREYSSRKFSLETGTSFGIATLRDRFVAPIFSFLLNKDRDVDFCGDPGFLNN